MELLIFCGQISLVCIAVHVCITHQGMILNPVEKYLDYWLYDWLKKPLYGCLVCMSSFWTVFIWCLNIRPIGFELLYAVLIVAGLNKIACVYMEKNSEYGC